MKEQLNSELILAFTQGKQQGFNAIYKLFYREIHYFTYQLTTSWVESEDITLHTFMKLFKLHDRFLTLPNIKAFLYVTAKNNSMDYLRSATHKKMISKDFSVIDEGNWSDELEESAAQHAAIETVVMKQIYEAVETLPEQCQRIFKLLFYEGKKPADISRELGISPETVRSQKRHALELLRIRLSDNQLIVAWLLWLSMNEWHTLLPPPASFA